MKSESPAVDLEVAAPPSAHLRFAGIGDNIELRVDVGSWEPAQLQAAARMTLDEHFASYWHPNPAGAANVEFRGDDWWGGPWLVRDLAVWSLPSG